MAACILISPFGVAPDAIPGGTRYVSENVRLAPLANEHKLSIINYLDDLKEESLSRFVRTIPAFVIPFSEVAFLKAISDDAERGQVALGLHRFCIEAFVAERVPMAAFAFDGERVIAHSIDEDGHRHRADSAISPQSVEWEKHLAYLEFAYSGLSTAPLAPTVIGRISKAFRQGASLDGIIDLAIALECLIDANIEIKFQFSLFHALVNEASTEARAVAFDRLQSLYDLRSAGVHGSAMTVSYKKKQKVVEDAWSYLLKMARDNLTYYIEYCRTKDAKSWPKHLRELALGSPRLRYGVEQ